MRYPKLKELPATRRTVDAFRGYNHNLRISDGEAFNMTNMTSDFYPVMSPRARRGVLCSLDAPQGIIAKDKLCYVDGTAIIVGEDWVDMQLSTLEADCPKQLVSMGAYIIIMPDKKYINTMDLEDRGEIEASYTSTADVKFELCSITAETYEDTTVSAAAPENPENMQLWIDTSAKPHALKQYSSASEQWVSIATTYLKISAQGIGKCFKQYDGVTISGVKHESLQDLNATMVIWACDDDYIVVVGIADEVLTQTAAEGAVTVQRRMPNIDYLAESENRLWGCRYGLAANGEMVNEIYACALGDFRNWNRFMGLSTDSYAASCGTDGAFTGAVTHLGYPIFFKENCLHKVYGNYPANYQIQTTTCRGVQKGSHRSIAIVNEVLYYKSRTSVCAYDGSLPTEASYALGNESYFDAVGGSHGNKYYISMRDVKGIWHLFVYDTAKGMWHREDNLHADGFCSWLGELYCIDHDSRKILTMLSSDDEPEENLPWMWETGEIGISSPDTKYISRITVRMSLEVGTEVRVYAQYDFSEKWEPLFALRSTNLRSFSIPIRPKRCDFMKIRIDGDGGAKIYGYTKTIEQGSEIT